MAPMPSGCSFWRLASEGCAFYTVPADHFNCAVGSYTHNIPLSPAREKETEQTLGLMFQVGYIKPEEVAGIPRLKKTPRQSSTRHSAKLLCKRRGTVRVQTIRSDAAERSCDSCGRGRRDSRPWPADVHGFAAWRLERGTQMSLGCIGNRTYTGLGDNELYIIIPGKSLEKVAAALETIATANAAVADYARGRKSDLATI